MTAILLTCNPDHWTWDDYEEEVQRSLAGEAVSGSWSVGRRRDDALQPGDRAFLLSQGRDRGLLAAGTFSSEIYEDEHWRDADRLARYADVVWDVLLPMDLRVPVEQLKAAVPSVAWDYQLQSGNTLLPPADVALDEFWLRYCASLDYDGARDVPEDDLFTEGGVSRRLVNCYERDRAARAACIEHYGTRCVVCDLDFGKTYGPLGKGFVHVHHLVEISSVGATHVVDPVQDLRPVCANCHCMLHMRRPALRPAELKTRMPRAAASRQGS